MLQHAIRYDLENVLSSDYALSMHYERISL